MGDVSCSAQTIRMSGGSFHPMHQIDLEDSDYRIIRRPVGKHTRPQARTLFGARDKLSRDVRCGLFSPNNEDGRVKASTAASNRP